ncbi:DUF4249 domain-containing protein [Flavobacterium sp. GCM10023249]|uniref:DUF4249 domain-containing protein n=1 Tax=unclassified Flavobacterium TaxID=196869 RepID=UPI003618453E
MKRFLFIITIAALLNSCQDTVDIPLETGKPKLVINAVIKWAKGTTGENQTIKLSLTNDFYSNTVVFANGATVTVTNSSNTVFNFVEDPGTGNYICTNFQPVINENYTLTVLYQGQTYTSTEKLIATPPIINVQQQTVPGPTGADEIQVKYFFQDNGTENNFYLLGVRNSKKKVQEYGVVSNEFFQGNVMFGFYASEVEEGNTLKLSLQGITNSYYNYMNKLIPISSTNTGNPFATPPATLRGNIINQTNSNEYPLGYFALGETDTRDYVVQ